MTRKKAMLTFSAIILGLLCVIGGEALCQEITSFDCSKIALNCAEKSCCNPKSTDVESRASSLRASISKYIYLPDFLTIDQKNHSAFLPVSQALYFESFVPDVWKECKASIVFLC